MGVLGRTCYRWEEPDSSCHTQCAAQSSHSASPPPHPPTPRPPPLLHMPPTSCHSSSCYCEHMQGALIAVCSQLIRIVSKSHCASDTLAEWLRRRPAKPMGSPRAGSNPAGVGFLTSHVSPCRGMRHKLCWRANGHMIPRARVAVSACATQLVGASATSQGESYKTWRRVMGSWNDRMASAREIWRSWASIPVPLAC